MKSKLLFLRTLLPSFILIGAVLFSVAPVGCKMTEEGIQLLAGDFSVPHVQSFTVVDQRNVSLLFDKQVAISSAQVVRIDGENGDEKEVIQVEGTPASDGKGICLALAKEMEAGVLYTLTGTVSDGNGNTLTVSMPFSGYNANTPVLALSEVRNAYSTLVDKTAGSKSYKCEFIELYAVTEGNLAGLVLLNAGDGEENAYAFPTVEVAAGEYIVVHLRKMEEGCVDELDEDLTRSTATDSCPTARDLWVNNTKARLAQSDIIMIKNTNNGEIIDALVFAKDTLETWSASYAPYVSAVEKSGMWTASDGVASCAITSAVVSNVLTSAATTRTLSRQNIQKLNAEVKTAGCAADWIIVASKGVGKNRVAGDTPGLPNSTNAYIAK